LQEFLLFGIIELCNFFWIEFVIGLAVVPALI